MVATAQGASEGPSIHASLFLLLPVAPGLHPYAPRTLLSHPHNPWPLRNTHLPPRPLQPSPIVSPSVHGVLRRVQGAPRTSPYCLFLTTLKTALVFAYKFVLCFSSR